tara:strand:- start:342 stop:1466 length:1125 start_codon:yes stop_codon:yes gene_type:complete
MFKKILNAVVQLCLLCFISLTASADVALRVVCSGSDEGAVVYINDKKQGACPNDFFVEAGDIQFRAVKIVDADHEQVYEEHFFIEAGGVKKIKVSLSKARLNAAAIKQQNLAKLNKEKQFAALTLAEAQTGDIDAMNSIALLYEQGKGVMKSLKESEYWKAEAIKVQQHHAVMKVLNKARQSDVQAIDELIDIYTTGKGVKADALKAQQWKDKKTAILQAQDELHAQEVLKKAEAGDLDAMKAIAGLYQSGNGLERSDSKAKDWQDKYSDLKTKQDFQASKDAELQAMKDELESADYFFALNLAFKNLKETYDEGDAIWVSMATISLPSMAVSTVVDLLSAPYRTTQQVMLENEIDLHVAKWGNPNSMVAKSKP